MATNSIPIYLGLVHHPIVNKRGEVITTSVTNLDIHDIARSCKTFGISRYFIVTPLTLQQELVGRILGHWEEDKASVYNPDRHNALELATIISSVELAVQEIAKQEGKTPLLAVTGANFKQYHGEMRDLLKASHGLDDRPIFVLFGTGWGLHSSIVDLADFKLAPIDAYPATGYNHLSVRSAVAIYLDRLSQARKS